MFSIDRAFLINLLEPCNLWSNAFAQYSLVWESDFCIYAKPLVNCTGHKAKQIYQKHVDLTLLFSHQPKKHSLEMETMHRFAVAAALSESRKAIANITRFKCTSVHKTEVTTCTHREVTLSVLKTWGVSARKWGKKHCKAIFCFSLLLLFFILLRNMVQCSHFCLFTISIQLGKCVTCHNFSSVTQHKPRLTDNFYFINFLFHFFRQPASY